jgi:hypothetical protein
MFLAVFLANIAAWLFASVVGLVYWFFLLDVVNDLLSQSLNELQGSFPSQVISNNTPIIVPQVSIKPPKPEPRSSYSATAIQTNREMCHYWTSQASSNPTEQFKAYRDNACMRYRNSMKP